MAWVLQKSGVRRVLPDVPLLAPFVGAVSSLPAEWVRISGPLVVPAIITRVPDFKADLMEGWSTNARAISLLPAAGVIKNCFITKPPFSPFLYISYSPAYF